MLGEIRKPQMVHIHDYSQLRYGNITPTDVDGLLDFGNRLFVFVELKYGNAQMPYGQQLALTRVVDAITTVPAYLLLAHHQTPQGAPIAAHNALVSSYYMRGRWLTPRTSINLLQAIECIRVKELTR